MRNDIRVYNYDENSQLINRMTQAEAYLDKKFANIKVDVDLDDVEMKLNKINCNIRTKIEGE